MKNYFKKYKPFLLFLATFFVVYGVLTFAYQYYLNQFEGNEVDAITDIVGYQVGEVLRILGFDGKTVHFLGENFVRLYYADNYVARVIEGCNAISVIILFVAFVAAFSGKFKATAFFILLGSILIYILNILRITLLTVLIYNFPSHENILHGVVFPLIIYGVVFVLWFVWINKYSKYAQ